MAADTPRELANYIKNGQNHELAQALTQDFKDLKRSDFQALMSQIERTNSADLKVNAHIPAGEFRKNRSGNYELNITTPGQIFGNHWRDETIVWRGDLRQSSRPDNLLEDDIRVANTASSNDAFALAGQDATTNKADYLRAPGQY
jgi:hypothetical protein